MGLGAKQDEPNGEEGSKPTPAPEEDSNHVEIGDAIENGGLRAPRPPASESVHNYPKIPTELAQRLKAALKEGRVADFNRERPPESFRLGPVNAAHQDLTAIDLSHVSLGPGSLVRANLTRANAVGAQFINVSLASADFTDAVLDQVHILEGGADAARFERTSLRGSAFQDSSVSTAVFQDADLSGAIVSPRTDVDRAVFRRVHGLDTLVMMPEQWRQIIREE